MNEIKDKLIKVGNKILISSRNELYVAMRFLDITLSGLSYEYDETICDIATNGEKIFFNPIYLVEKYKIDRITVNRTYLHMVIHCILRHFYKKREKKSEYWDLACDIVVENIIDGLNYKKLSINITKSRQEIYNTLGKEMKVLTAERIYKYIIEGKLSDYDFENLYKEFYVDNHCYWYIDKDENYEYLNNSSYEMNIEGENKNSNRTINDQYNKLQNMLKKWQDISEKMKTNLETFSKESGDKCGNLLQHIKVANRERYDYKTFLKKFAVLREEVQVDDDSFDYIFYTYGLQLYGNIPLIEPLEYKEVKKIDEFVIAIDTSGSCSGEVVKNFIEETYSILNGTESFFKKVNIHIIQCDTQVQEDSKITSRDELEEYMNNFSAKGLGGTDFRPVFDYVNELNCNKEFTNLKGLIYFTDGYGVFPIKRPNYDVAFVFLKDDYSNINVPHWSMKLILESDDLRKTC